MPARIGTGRAVASGRILNRARFRQRLSVILGDNRLIWMPKAGDTTATKSEETSAGRDVTYDGSVASRLSQLGRGIAQSFSGSGQYAYTPDAADLSFGNGSADQPLSIVALVNATANGAGKDIVTKWTTGAIEYRLTIRPFEDLIFVIADQSAAPLVYRLSSAGIATGGWHVFGVSYDGGGGATAANGITLYQDGAVIASAATNDAAYVAMENGTAEVGIGTREAHTSTFFAGSKALIALGQKNLSAADHVAATALCRRYFGVPL